MLLLAGEVAAASTVEECSREVCHRGEDRLKFTMVDGLLAVLFTVLPKASH